MVDRRWLAGLWLGRWAVTLALFGCFGGDDVGDDEGTTGGSTSPSTSSAATTSEGTSEGTSEATSGGTVDASTAASTETSGTSAPACVSDDACPPSDDPCRVARCESGVCGFEAMPQGTILDDAPRDCRQTVCDGVGGGESVAADDPPEETLGDCKSVACADGGIVYLVNDDDLPDDEVECTVDTCVEGVPTFTAKPTNSFCGPMGSEFCHDDTVCRRCEQIEICVDPGPEPSETQDSAHELGKISDADSAGGFVCGALDGPGDVDWYHFTGDDVFLNVVDPTRVIGADGGRICAYAQCLKGTTSVTCFTETPDVAPGGQKGCCDPDKVKPYVECSGLDDSAEIWIRIDNPGADACVPYDFDYHF